MKSLKILYKNSGLNEPNKLELNSVKENSFIDCKKIKLTNNKNDIFFLSKDIDQKFQEIINLLKKENIEEEDWFEEYDENENDIHNDIIFSSKIENINLIKKKNDNTIEIENIDSSINHSKKALMFLFGLNELTHNNLKEVKDILSENKNFFDDGISKEKFYRDDDVFIFKKVNGLDQRIHKGINDKKIWDSMTFLFNYINDANPKKDNIKDVILRTGITHILFEYIHPYFDGNGRVGRMILSSQFKKSEFHYINKVYPQLLEFNKSKYYNALEHSQKTKLLDYYLIFHANLILDSIMIHYRLFIIKKEIGLSNIQYENLKKLLIIGICTNEFNYPSIKKYYKDISKQGVIKQLNILAEKGALTYRVDKKNKYFILNPKYK